MLHILIVMSRDALKARYSTSYAQAGALLQVHFHEMHGISTCKGLEVPLVAPRGVIDKDSIFTGLSEPVACSVLNVDTKL